MLTFACPCLCLRLHFCMNLLANELDLNCSHGRDNAGQSRAAAVARKAGGTDRTHSKMFGSANNRLELCMFVSVLMRQWLFLLCSSLQPTVRASSHCSTCPKCSSSEEYQILPKARIQCFTASEEDCSGGIMPLRSERSARSRTTEVRNNTFRLESLMALNNCDVQAVLVKRRSYSEEMVFCHTIQFATVLGDLNIFCTWR